MKQESGENYIMKSLQICTLTQYCSSDKIEKNEMGRACITYVEKRGVHRVLVGKPDGRRPLGIYRRRWEDNIKTDL